MLRSCVATAHILYSTFLLQDRVLSLPRSETRERVHASPAKQLLIQDRGTIRTVLGAKVSLICHVNENSKLNLLQFNCRLRESQQKGKA